MSSFNQLVLPLLGGYLFLSFTFYFKFYHSKLDRQRLIFNSAVTGFCSLICSFLIVLIWESLSDDFNILRSISSYLYNLYPGISDIEFLDIIVLSFFLPIILIFITNYIEPPKKSFESIINRWGDSLDFVIYNSFKNNNNPEDKLLLLTFKNNKVYIAFINQMTLPIKDSYINFIPILSGYRDKDTLKIVYTTDYSKIIFDEIDDNIQELKNKLGITVRRDELLFVTQFDFKILEGIEIYNGLSSSNSKAKSRKKSSTK